MVSGFEWNPYLDKSRNALIYLFSSVESGPLLDSLLIVDKFIPDRFLVLLEKFLLLPLSLLVLLNLLIVGQPDFNVEAEELEPCSQLPLFDDSLDELLMVLG